MTRNKQTNGRRHTIHNVTDGDTERGTDRRTDRNDRSIKRLAIANRSCDSIFLSIRRAVTKRFAPRVPALRVEGTVDPGKVPPHPVWSTIPKFGYSISYHAGICWGSKIFGALVSRPLMPW